jgi:hypothetical protein
MGHFETSSLKCMKMVDSSTADTAAAEVVVMDESSVVVEGASIEASGGSERVPRELFCPMLLAVRHRKRLFTRSYPDLYSVCPHP